ncbi:hypothetical protein [Limimaricola pyoseonensis]|uniref:Uncharacterized protein n=1 Tax=Limimaricola pyoseonensis TaxID=521013 RepID=A0A1G7AIP8_9RHOB|nr:hypothetical protein [Limimaricola pyoseonensis]SDE14642.1 hypothetical protein SAMN04488567_0975 [Limimaricola pyoseonensis]
MRYQTTEQELPARMRRFLADIDASRAYFSDTLIKQRQHISSALRGLIDAAKLDGLPLQLSQQTAQAFTSRLEREGWAPASIACQHGYLRKYAYETGEGMDWALTSGRFDRRPLALVFRAAHWAPYRSLLDEIEQGCEASLIRLADRWMRYRKGFPTVTEPMVRGFKADARSLSDLTTFMGAIDPESPDNIVLQQVQGKRRNEGRGEPARKKQPPWHDLHQPFHLEVQVLMQRAQKPNGLSAERIKAICSALRRLEAACRKRGLAIELTMVTARAFAEEVFDADLATRSKAAYCDFLAAFARHAGYSGEIRAALMDTHNALKLEAGSDLRRKEIALAEHPLDLVGLAETAREMLEHASEQDDIRARRRDVVLAGAMALLCKMPLRSLDLRSGRIGQEFRRDSEGWLAALETSKTGERIDGRLASCLTPYLDAVLLMDVGPQHLWSIYHQRVGTALFGNPARSWKPFGDNWLWDNMRKRTHHGPHIVRTLIYDAVVADDDLDLRVAQALCGHGHEASRQFYEINADRYRREEGLQRLIEAESRAAAT